MNSRTEGRMARLDRTILFSQGLFLVIAFGFFLSLGHYVLVFQEAQSLFIFSGDYLRESISAPGDALAVAGTFLTQFYAGRIVGPLVLAVVLTLPAFLLYLVTRRISPSSPVSWLFLLLPSGLLFLLQIDLYHGMECNLGMSLVVLYYLFWVSAHRGWQRALALAFVPLFYFLAGAYVLVLAGLLVVHALAPWKERRTYLDVSLLLIITAVSVLFFWNVLFLQSAGRALLYPFPSFENPAYDVVLVILATYIVFFPLLARLSDRVSRSGLNKPVFSLPSKGLILALALWGLFLEYDPQIGRVVELEHLVHAGKWDDAIELQERTPTRFQVAEYLYNVALSETGQLCDRLFSGPQDYGPESLYLPLAMENLSDGGLFYYGIGLTNEAHRWAFEDMVTYGYRPRSLRMLARTSLLNGDYGMARKYLRVLKGTLFYRGWAKGLEDLVDDPDQIRSRPELAAKLAILPKTNFFVEYTVPERNLSLLLGGQPDNGEALEYLLARALLTKDVRYAVNGIRELKDAGYTRIPRHLQEAALLQRSVTNTLPDLGGLTISPETEERFERFTASLRAARTDLTATREQMRKEFGDTYWFYYYLS